MSRYLTPQEKAAELAAWDRIRSELAGVAGPGVPDPGIVPWCERINALPGVCTLQSCEGHESGERGPSGHIWLWMDAPRSERFRDRAFELAQRNVIEKVTLLYHRMGREVVEIEFKGSPAFQLERSMQTIVGFLESL